MPASVRTPASAINNPRTVRGRAPTERRTAISRRRSLSVVRIMVTMPSRADATTMAETALSAVSAVSFAEHEDKPFRVCGILEKTGTPVDRTVHVSLEAIEAIHVDWQSGGRIPGQAQSDYGGSPWPQVEACYFPAAACHQRIQRGAPVGNLAGGRPAGAMGTRRHGTSVPADVREERFLPGKLRFDSVLVPTSRQPRSHWLMLVAQARGRLCLPCRRQRSSTSPFGV